MTPLDVPLSAASRRKAVGPLSFPGTRRTPLKEITAREILAMIEDRGLQPGDKLPSEPELGAQFNRTRDTVRAAVTILVNLGVVERLQGKGMFVAKRDTILIDGSCMHDLDTRAAAAANPHDALGAAISGAGHQPSSRFSLPTITAASEPDFARLLGVDETHGSLLARVIHRSVNGNPRMIETGYFDPAIATQEGLERIAQPVDVIEGTTLLLSQLHPNLVAEHIIEARHPTLEENDFLRIDGCVLVQTIATYDRLGGKIIRVIRLVYRGDLYRIRFHVAGRGNVPMPPEIVALDSAS